MTLTVKEYYEENLKGKNEDELLAIIKSLKFRLGHLKRKVEMFEYADEYFQDDSKYYVQVFELYEYLDKAKDTLKEIGAIYSPSKSELKAIDFEKNIKNISRIEYRVGSYFDPRKYVLEFDGNNIKMTSTNPILGYENNEFYIPELSKKIVLSKIKSLRMGDWKSSYSCHDYGVDILDGTQWEIKIEFKNGHKPFEWSGDNAFPYNFFEFEDLFVNDHSELDNYDEEE